MPTMPRCLPQSRTARVPRWPPAPAACQRSPNSHRRTGNDQRADWACDFWDCAAAEVAAALTISHGKASGQMHLSLALNRLPQVAALFLAGHLGARLFSIIAWRTYLVRDPHALSLLDAALAEHAGAWGPLSAPKLEKAIDSWIDRYDPGALRRSRISARTRDLCIGDPDEDAGTAALWGRLYATDAAMLDRRLTERCRRAVRRGGRCVLRPGPDAVTPAADISAHQLVRAVVDTGAAHVMVLPNGYVAAEELVAGCTAAIGWGVDVVPVPTGSMVQGLAALAVHDAARQAVDDGYSMARAAGASRHGSVRIATQKALTWAGTCKPGDGLGIAGDEVLIVADDVAAAAIGLVDLLLASGGDLVTVLIGAGVTEDVAVVLERHVHDHHPGTELVSYRTGHRGDALLIGVE